MKISKTDLYSAGIGGLLALIAGVLILTCSAASNRIGLYQAFLQSNIDGNQLNLTNLNALAVSQIFLSTNALSAWPTAASLPGQAVFVNSNGTVYLLTSGPNATTWGATNKIAP